MASLPRGTPFRYCSVFQNNGEFAGCSSVTLVLGLFVERADYLQSSNLHHDSSEGGVELHDVPQSLNDIVDCCLVV